METVRERLEKLKNKPVYNPQQPHQPQPLITPEILYLKKLDKSIATIEAIRKKFTNDTPSYLSLFYEQKKAEKELMEILKEGEDKEFSIPDSYTKRIEEIKSKIRKY